MKKYLLMSTRYSDFGINTVSDVEIFQACKIVKNEKKQIYHIRLDYNFTTSAWENLTFFLNYVLPEIDRLFIVIITGEDLTFPNQVDIRWQNPMELELIKNTYNAIINHPLLIHCYIENRDEIHEKTSSIPLGINPREMPNSNIDYILKYMDNYSNLKSRELKVICVHRDRAGDRQLINIYKNTTWKNLVITDGEFKHDSWYNLLQTYPFIICAHGGGLDPCPKIWEALCCGCIPIIKKSALDDIYINFPVVFVDDWNLNTINENDLKIWLEKYSKYFDDKELRKEWVNKLFLNYWEDKIKSLLPINDL
jgi:hypothetical protein